MRSLLAALVIALAVPAAAQQPAPPTDPLIRENTTEKVGEHVYAIPDNSVPLVPNVGIVVGSRATLVVDTGLGARNAQTILKEVAKVSRNKELYLVTTHFHPEHDLGAHAFPASTKMIRSKDQVADISEFGLQTAKLFSQRSPLTAELLKDAEFRKADIVFDKEQSIDLGGVKVRILAMGPNHTRGDTAVFVEPDAVLFSGDVAMVPLPAFASPDSRYSQWFASLDRFDALKPRRIVPSHGPISDAAIIGAYRTYLKAVQARTGELKKQGKTVDETVATVTSELAAKYPDKGRVTGAVRAAYAEAS
jgi:glyoxylase-like metal-dependent hydrolase (beta-lactamase superfamily II)